MGFDKLLIANRGEIAVRIARSAAELGLATVGVYAADDADSLHVTRTDEACALDGRGARAYMDAEQLIDVAVRAGCDAVHPGYGFLAETPSFATRCERAGLAFVGPQASVLARFGDKARARALAVEAGVPVLDGTDAPTSLAEARAFFDKLADGQAMMIKAVSGGGGRGIRIVRHAAVLADAYERCRSEAAAAFGSGDVYVERFVPRARHIEVQVIGDRLGDVTHLYERECSLQRRHQKIVEIAPSPGLPAPIRHQLADAALEMARRVNYHGLGTFEFLVEDNRGVSFVEANPRLQVEHTVTEQVLGLDLVRLQLELARGATLGELELTGIRPRGFSMQVRINLETMGEDGSVRPSSGALSVFEPPTGRGIRVDTCGYAGYSVNPNYDSLLAKLICYSASFQDVLACTYRALCEFRIEGVSTNIGFLQNLVRHGEVASQSLHTRLIDDHIEALAGSRDHRRLYFAPAAPPEGLAGARVAASDPLAVLAHGKAEDRPALTDEPVADDDSAVLAPMQGTIVSIEVKVGDTVRAGSPLFIMEAMKMEHVIPAPSHCVVRAIRIARGDIVVERAVLAHVDAIDADLGPDHVGADVDLDAIRPDVEQVRERHAIGLDERRPDAVARRRKTGHRTARENLADLVDPDSFVEYGPLVIAAQRRRRSVDELIEKTPADGMIGGVGSINGDLFGPDRSQCVVMSYDYTVLAGTQGHMNHLKKDRLLTLAERQRTPVVLFAEGGGGRPGDTDGASVAGLDCYAFYYFARLSGLVPLIGITTGRCFAGNAALLGCCDVVIATEGSNIGMGGPAMVEGGGLGVFRPEDIGPMSVQVPNGVVDIETRDEAEAVAAARRYVSYFQGKLPTWSTPDQRLLRHVIPENRVRTYDVRRVIEILADDSTVLEIRRGFGVGMITALARIEGRPIGIIANNPVHLGGAIDSDGADKASRFMQLCDAFDIPLLLLCDTPGFMVGPDAETTAQVRHFSRMFVVGANLDIPVFTIVLRKGYGLGAMAMTGGGFKIPLFTVGWPTSEFGAMGIEGAVKLGYRKELAAIEDVDERREAFEDMVARAYERGKGISLASVFEIDDVIDPIDSRRWILAALRSAKSRPPRDGKKRSFVDTW